ncbi:hypothetical protein [Silanimonas sp.]|uniref:hypothetical protein n=1 Tax=Silanimonas sp. TaxID=1929290 RepID=UPI0022C6927B|nr:hypothetical protein [Silanimonas sp.]MCZ8166704.1 hypothetical protein [Silanimonas sp.]
MSTVWRWLSRVLSVIALAIAVVLALYAYGRLTTPTPSQRDALALMQESAPMPEGENGFPLLMVASPPEGDWPMALSCRGEGASCLDAVQSAPEAHEAALLANSPALDAAERALRAPVFRNPDMTPAATDVLPPFQMVIRLSARRAFEFAAGRESAALGATCRDAADFARWSREQDSMVHAMIAVAGFRQSAALIGEMRARTPTVPMPDACLALAALPDPAAEGLICDGLRSEWRMIDGIGISVVDQVPEAQRPSVHWLHSPEQFSARSAERMAGYCGPAAVDAALRDDIDGARLDSPPRAIDRLSFPVSHILGEIAGGVMYADYWERQLDHVARRRLLAAFLQMEAMPAGLSNAERFAALPAELRDGPRPLRFDAGANTLGVALRGRQHDGAPGNEALLMLPSVSPASAPLAASLAP